MKEDRKRRISKIKISDSTLKKSCLLDSKKEKKENYKHIKSLASNLSKSENFNLTKIIIKEKILVNFENESPISSFSRNDESINMELYEAIASLNLKPSEVDYFKTKPEKNELLKQRTGSTIEFPNKEIPLFITKNSKGNYCFIKKYLPKDNTAVYCENIFK